MQIARSITNEEFLQYKLQEQSFIMLPFEHSENLEDQANAVKLANQTSDIVLERGGDANIEAITKYVKSLSDYAVQHQVIIQKFGRFPHRNGVLERESTDEEIEYLKSANSFGQ